MQSVYTLLLNLVLTILIEGALGWLLIRRWRFCYITFLGNLLTNPIVNLLLILLLRLAPGLYWYMLVLLELGAVCAEAALYHDLWDMPRKRACLTSLLLNVVSCGSGLLLWTLAPVS